MLPNLITGLRLVLLVPLYLCLTQGERPERWAALGLYLFAGLTDVIDGRIARATGQTSALGHALDRMADGLLTLVAVFGLLHSGVLRDWAAAARLIVIGRGFVVSGLELAYPSRLDITVSGLEKIKIALQFVGLSLLMAPWAPGFDAHAVGGWIFVACAAVTVITLAGYIWRAIRAARGGAPYEVQTIRSPRGAGRAWARWTRPGGLGEERRSARRRSCRDRGRIAQGCAVHLAC